MRELQRWSASFLILLATVSLYGFAKGPAPYGVDKRPLPRGEDPNVLAPLTVGEFKRPAFPKGTKTPSDEDLTVEYKAGGRHHLLRVLVYCLEP